MNNRKKILIINGSIRGEEGNSWSISNNAKEHLYKKFNLESSILTLTDPKQSIQEISEILSSHDGFFVVSGVYWNNWSSSLQRFIEVITIFENSPIFFGKPIACAVSMDSVGGIEVASRIHATFTSLGCWSPPCSTLVLSRVGLEAISASKGNKLDPNEDVWRLDDIEIVLNNLVTATSIKNIPWVSWPHVELKISDAKWPNEGPLNMNSPKYL